MVLSRSTTSKPERAISVAAEASACRSEIANTATEPILQTYGLVKIYTRSAQSSIRSTSTYAGARSSVCLGPNGAGKTTSFYMIVGLVPPNAGPD